LSTVTASVPEVHEASPDRYGRKPVLVAGWIIGVPVPLIWAPNWGWVIATNVLLGINQGLAWSTTVIMKIDLVGPTRRGLAMGFNVAAGYGAVALTALATGWIADALSIEAAIWAIAALTALSGMVVIIRMYETLPLPAEPAGPGITCASSPAAPDAGDGRP
jgi:MFS family permease